MQGAIFLVMFNVFESTSYEKELKYNTWHDLPFPTAFNTASKEIIKVGVKFQ